MGWSRLAPLVCLLEEVKHDLQLILLYFIVVLYCWIAPRKVCFGLCLGLLSVHVYNSPVPTDASLRLIVFFYFLIFN